MTDHLTANADMTSTVGEGRHLPECPLATDCKHDYYNEPPVQCADCGEVCICDLLRACEERVLDAAREAVQRVGIQPEPVQQYTKSLAAIDALRGEQ